MFVQRLRVWLAVVVAVGAIEALYGAYQAVGQHTQIYWLQKTAYLDSATGTFVNRNHLAGYLELTIPVAIALALWLLAGERLRGGAHAHSRASTPGRRRRAGALRRAGSRGALGLAALAATGLMLVVMGLTRSRGGLLSCLGGLTLGAAGFGWWRREITFRRVVLGALAAGGLALVWLESPELLQRFGAGLTPHSRPSVWRETLVMARDFPLLGVGLGNFEFVFPAYQPAGTFTYFRYAHNDYLQLLAETGIFGAACFAWLFLRFGTLLRRRLWHSPPEKAVLALGLATAVATLSLHSFVDFNLHIPANALLFVVAFGAIVRLLEDEGRSTGSPDPVRSRAVGMAIGAVACLASALVLRNWWVESTVRRFFPDTSLVSPSAPSEEPFAAQVAGLDDDVDLAPGNAEVAESVGWMARRIAEAGMEGDAHLASDERERQTAEAWTAAVVAYRAAVERRPTRGYAHLRLGHALSMLAEIRHGLRLPPDVLAEVTRLCDSAARLEPHDPFLTRSISEWALTHWPLLAAEDRERATRWVHTALALDPLRARELLRIALVWDAVLAERLASDDAEVRFQLALAHRDGGRAVDAARIAAALDDQLGERLRAHGASAAEASLLGRVRELREQPGGAAEAYEQAALLSTEAPSRGEARKRSGYAWLRAGEADKAREAFRRARIDRPGDPEVLAGLSAVEEQAGDLAAAARLIRDALAVAQDGAPYRYRLARIHERAGEYGKANEQYRQLLDDSGAGFAGDHRSDILLALARNYRRLELAPEARRFYQLVLENDPENAEAREFLSYFGP